MGDSSATPNAGVDADVSAAAGPSSSVEPSDEEVYFQLELQNMDGMTVSIYKSYY